MCIKQLSVKQTYDNLGVEMIIESGVKSRYAVLLTDYLKAVEELQQSKLSDKSKEEYNIKMYNDLKEKDEEIKGLKFEIGDKQVRLKVMTRRCNKLEEELRKKDETYLKMLNERNHYLDEVVKLKNDECLELYDFDKNKFKKLKKELKEKDEEIERLKREIDINREQRNYWEQSSNHNYKIGNELERRLEKTKDINVDLAFENSKYKKEIKELKKENERLKENNEVLTQLLKGEEEEKLWVLKYIYCDNEGNCKNVSLDPQPLEEIHEIVGMDCDNWVSWTIEKEEE